MHVTQSYCGVSLDDNNQQPITPALPTGPEVLGDLRPGRTRLEPDQVGRRSYNFADQLRATVITTSERAARSSRGCHGLLRDRRRAREARL